MTDSCRVRAHLLEGKLCTICGHTHGPRPNGAGVNHGCEPVCAECSGDADCSGPRVNCLLGVTKEAVEAKYPHGAADWASGWRPWHEPEPPIMAGNSAYLPLPDLLHRLSTQECRICGGKGRRSSWVNELGRELEGECPDCHGTGRVGTVCSGHLGLVTECPVCSGERFIRGYTSPDRFTTIPCPRCDGEKPQIDPATLKPTDPVLVDSLGLGVEP